MADSFKFDNEWALDFMVALSAIVVGPENTKLGLSEEAASDTSRLSRILELLIDNTPVVHASLWKLKDRAKQASLLALPTTQLKSAINRHERFVVPFGSSELQFLLEQHRNLPDEFRCNLGLVPFDRQSDGICHFSQNAAKECSVGTRDLACLFGSLCQPQPGDVPNFLLHLAICGKKEDSEQYWVPQQVLEAVCNKTVSGVCALIDRKTKRITDGMTSVDLASANAGAALSMQRSIERVIPRFLKCKRILRIEPTSDGTYRIAMNFSPFSIARSFELTDDCVDDLGQLISDEFDNVSTASSRKGREDAILPSPVSAAKLNEILGRARHAPVKSAMFGKIQNRTAEDNSRGFMVLLDRLNDFSFLTEPKNDFETDFFDWEDELILSHICSILDLIDELFSAEDSRLSRAHILSHEMHAPTGFIFSTAERHLADLDKDKPMPKGMQKRELSDLLLYSELQANLIDQMMIGLQPGLVAPNRRYRPQKVNFDKIAENTRRLSLVACRRWGANQGNIKMRSFPSFFFDSRAANQIFMNLTTNAIKYSFAKSPSDFQFSAYSEWISTEELSVLNVPSRLLKLIETLGCRSGYLFSFEDNGIGVDPSFSDRMFSAGSREQSPHIQSRLGAGLGLSVVRAIMRDHFGDAWLEIHKNPTTLCLFFPDFLRNLEFTKRPEWLGASGDTN